MSLRATLYEVPDGGLEVCDGERSVRVHCHADSCVLNSFLLSKLGKESWTFALLSVYCSIRLVLHLRVL
jgi:hypothetical protein